MKFSFHLAPPTLFLLVLPVCVPLAQAADPVPEKGKPLAARVASSGPIHEAFAAPQPTTLAPPELVEKTPPKPLNEVIPDEKPEGDGVQWIPGYWEYDPTANTFVWVSGVWRTPPPGRQWAAGYWTRADGQWRRQPGFWAAFSETSKNQELVYYPKPPDPKSENLAVAPPNTVFAPDHGPMAQVDTPGTPADTLPPILAGRGRRQATLGPRRATPTRAATGITASPVVALPMLPSSFRRLSATSRITTTARLG